MEDRFERALKKWPNVPALFGWLSLDRRGRWRIRGELINRPQIIDTINRHYACDKHGRWYFQNGPQRGYVSLGSAPIVLRCDEHEGLLTHHGKSVEKPTAAYLDEEAGIWMETEHGPACLEGPDIGWALERIRAQGKELDDTALATALSLPTGSRTALSLAIEGKASLSIERLDTEIAPSVLGFDRDPKPRTSEAESAASGNA